MTDSLTRSSTSSRGILFGGVAAGILGATVLALWFLLIDGVSGRALHTPRFLAGVLLGSDSEGLGGVALYTFLHYLLFLAVGIGLAWVVARLRVVPTILLGVALGFLLFDLLFYGALWITGVDVVTDLGWPAVLAGNIMAGVAMASLATALGPTRSLDWGALLGRNAAFREGLIAGLIGAVAVAAWFLIVDTLGGRLLFTPAALGSIVFHGASSAAEVRVDALTVLGFSLLHFGAFVVVGLVAAGMASYAEARQSYILLGAVLLFVTFETFLIGIIAVLAEWLLVVIPWWSFAVANIIAAAAMGAYLWSRHPRLVGELRHTELERQI